MVRRAVNELRRLGFGADRSIPSLDGMRAVSIAFVLTAHLTGTAHFPNIVPLEKLGELGVRVFFVISGYLITSILLRELSRRGSISLPGFYFRRTLRLFPACYFLIAVIALLASMHIVRLERFDIAAGVTYLMNYYENRGWPLGHLWSLAVEEQFYLVWPVTLWILGPARSGRLLIGVLAIAPFLRLASPYAGPAFNFVIWSDALAAGCLLAIFSPELNRNGAYMRFVASRWFFLVPCAVVAANYVPFTKIYWLICVSVMNIGIALSTDWAMRYPAGMVGAFLNRPLVAFLGVLSYSLYLWQQMFLNRTSNAWYCAFPVNIAMALTMALFSYLLIEAPFLRLRARLEAGHRERAGLRIQPTFTRPGA
jgi:peptidoglycan/LPS O-acetylase OafA/YrhL